MPAHPPRRPAPAPPRSAEPRRAPLVVFCGIDGSGKSTLVRRLAESGRWAGVRCMSRENRENFWRLYALWPDRLRRPETYRSGALAYALRWSTTLDFVDHYRRAVAPALRDPAPVFHDRWAPCLMAWARAVAGPSQGPALDELLACLPPADLVVHLDPGPEVALRRLEARGNAGPDERLETLRAFAAGYHAVLPRVPSPVVTIRAQDADEVTAEAEAAVAAALDGGAAPSRG